MKKVPDPTGQKLPDSDPQRGFFVRLLLRLEYEDSLEINLGSQLQKS